jgi:hypothetical protein
MLGKRLPLVATLNTNEERWMARPDPINRADLNAHPSQKPGRMGHPERIMA